MNTDIKDREDCLKLANELSKIIGENHTRAIKIDSGSMGVVIDEISFTGQYACFYFGETKPPFHIIKDNDRGTNYARVEIMNTLQRDNSSDFIEYQDIFALVQELADHETRRGIKESLELLKEKGFKVKQPTLSTNKTILFIHLSKYDISVKFNLKASFYNHYNFVGNN